MTMTNLTPHPITLCRPDGTQTTIAPSGKLARVQTTEEADGALDGVPVVYRRFGEIEIPEVEDGGALLVSSLVLEAAKTSKLPHETLRRLFAPDTGPTAKRNAAGQVQAVTRLVGCV